MSMRMKKNGDWIEYVTEKGSVFYYNQRDGSFQWDSPWGNAVNQSNLASGRSPHGAATALETLPEYSNRGKDRESEAAAPGMSVDGKSEVSICASTGDWQPYFDQDSGSVFWYNHKTCISQWECPAEFERASPQYQQLLHSEHNDIDNIFDDGSLAPMDENSVFAIHDHENDLGI